jgi:hypothetical protein
MLSYHSWLTRSFIIGCWAIIAGSFVTGCLTIRASRDHLLLEVELSQLTDKIICYQMLSYHSWQTRSIVTGCTQTNSSERHPTHNSLLYTTAHSATGVHTIHNAHNNTIQYSTTYTNTSKKPWKYLTTHFDLKNYISCQCFTKIRNFLLLESFNIT